MHPQTHTDQAPSPLTPSQQFLRGIGITESVPPADAVYYHYLGLQRQYAFRRHENSSDCASDDIEALERTKREDHEQAMAELGLVDLPLVRADLLASISPDIDTALWSQAL